MRTYNIKLKINGLILDILRYKNKIINNIVDIKKLSKTYPV